MLRNYIKVALRNLSTHKSYSLINIFGLAVGIAATVLIFLYILFEFSYDDFHKNKDSLYRISVVAEREGNIEGESAIFVPPIGPAMREEFPEVQNYARFSTPRDYYFYIDNNPVKVEDMSYADSTFFDVFSFSVLEGNPKNVLADPFSIVLTRSLSQRLFGSISPINKIIKIDNKNDFVVTGIVDDPPENSTIQFSCLASFETLYQLPNQYMDWNGGNRYYTYVQLQENVSKNTVESKFTGFMWKHINEELAGYNVQYKPYLQPIEDIHLKYNEENELGMTNIYIFAAIALLTLFVACFNFINLTTAHFTRRAKEVGIRKVIGANKSMLIKQFLTETILISFIALIFGVMLADLIAPVYQNLISSQFAMLDLIKWEHIAGLLLILIFTGLLAGSYPAFYLSSVQVIKSIRAYRTNGTSKFTIRNILLVFQFSISVGLIICTMIIASQLNYVHDKNLGYDNNNIVVIPLTTNESKQNVDVMKSSFSSLTGISSVTASSDIPFNGFTSNGYIPEGLNTPMMIHVVDVDEEFLNTYELKLMQGDNFTKEMSSDDNAYLVNETLTKTLGWDNPIGKTITRNGDHRVIGVVNDFHFASMYDKIEPLIITNEPWQGIWNRLSVKLNTANVNSVMSNIENLWAEINSGTPFEYWFLDESFDRLYKAELKFKDLFLYFSTLAIIIAILGLLSLASLSAQRRTKEIGVRKVMGASVTNIVMMIAKEFVRWVLISNIIAWPIAYFVMNKWIENFAYRADIEIWSFIAAGFVAFILAFITVSVRALRAANLNPVESLRYE